MMLFSLSPSGAGVVIHNHQDLVIASLLQKISQAFAPLEVEAFAATRALEFAVELGIKHAILEEIGRAHV